MTREETVKWLESLKSEIGKSENRPLWHYAESIDMAIEALKAKCPTCKWCSDHQARGTRCPIEEHYALLKDGFCHLYEPYKAESEDKK